MRFRGGFKPILALQFTGEAPPQAASTVQSPIPKCPDKIVRRIPRRFTEVQKSGKDVLNHVFGFGMAEPERPAIKHQAIRVGFEQSFSPMNISG
jgi:hypothetical protein